RAFPRYSSSSPQHALGVGHAIGRDEHVHRYVQSEQPQSRAQARRLRVVLDAGDWYATLVRMRHGTWVLAIAEKTCLPVVLSGRELRTFPQRLTETLDVLLDDLRVPVDVADRERAEMSSVLFARTNSRSHLGVLNTFEQSLRIALEEDPKRSLLELS